MKETLLAIKQFLTFHDPSNKIVGITRSLIAFSTLIILLFNNIDLLISPEILSSVKMDAYSMKGNFFLLFGLKNILIAKILAIVILLFVISGYFISITSILHFWVAASYFKFKYLFDGGDKIAMLLTLLLIPICLFDERKNHWNKPVELNKSKNTIKNIFLILIKFQVAFIYFDSMRDKLFIKEWQNGKAIYYWFTHEFYGLPQSISQWADPVFSQIVFLKIIAYGTLIFEAILSIGIIFSPKNRIRLLIAGLSFHFVIIFIHGIVSFSTVMAAALIIYLYPEKKWKLNSLHK